MFERESHKITWKKLTGGDETALSELYDQHYLALINYGRKIIDDSAFINDCFMDMLISFWNKRQTLPPVENVRSYLMTSLKRVVLHEIESGRLRESKHSQSSQLNDRQELSYEDYLIQIQTDSGMKLKISKALSKLTERQTELIRLKFFEDLDYDEIADKCGITKRTAYNIIHDAIKTLKQELYDDQNGSFRQNLSVFLLFY